MTRAIGHGFLKDEEHGTISQHLRNHIHLTNCIHLKNHMHRHSPIQAEKSLMRDLVVLQRSKSLRDPSTSPPSWLSPFVIATLVKRSGKDGGVHSGRRSVGVDVSHSKAVGLASFNVPEVGTSGDLSNGKESRDFEMRKGEDCSRSSIGEKASHSSLIGQNPRLKTLSEQLEEIPSQTDNEIRKPSRQRQHGGGEKRSKELKTNGHDKFSGFSRTKRRKFRGARRTHGGSVDLRGGRVHNDMSVASNSLAQGFAHHKCCLGEEDEGQENAEMDITQAPRHGCGIPWNWSRIHHRGKTFLDIAGRSLACGLSETRLRKDGGSIEQSQKERNNSKIPITSQLLTSSTGSDSEALPFLLDPSGSPEGNLNSCMSMACSGELGIYTNNNSHALDSDLVSEARSANRHCKGRHQNLTQKYMPKTFKDLVGQSLVVQALSNAVLRRKVGLIYVFYGPHGTGKTSCARVFAKALNCQSTEHPKPCDECTSCMSHNLGKSRDLLEVGAVSTFDIGRIMEGLNNATRSQSTSQYKVFIVDDCDTLPPDFWMAISKVAHHAPRHVVFILVSSSLDHLPHLIISRCQKFYFPKVKESDIILTLQWISTSEGLEIDKDALKLIASRSDGSLRDAEMTLDQLSLLGQRISLPLVQELVGLVSDEKLVDLLDVALSADTVGTIKSLREIIEAGVEPLALMSQLATLITDILAGSYIFTRERLRRKFFRRQTLSKEDTEKLRKALRTLSEAEKNLRLSNDKLTWLTAALLQIVPDQQYALTTSIDTNLNQAQLLVNSTDDRIEVGNAVHEEDEAFYSDRELNRTLTLESQRHRGIKNANSKIGNIYINGKEQFEYTPNGKENSSCKFGRSCRAYGKIWQQVIENIQPDALKQFLSQEGRLDSVRLGSAPTVQLVFGSPVSKSKAEKSRGQILQAFSSVLNTNVILEIRCNPWIHARQDAQVTNDMDEPENVSRMITIQQSMSNYNSHSQQSENFLRWLPRENAIKENGNGLARELQFDSLTMGRDRKGKGSECAWVGEGSSSQQHGEIAPLSGRKGHDEQNHSKSLVKGKVSLAHVIQQAEGCANHGGWSRNKAISITEKLEQENMRLESRCRSLLCWKGPRVTRSKFLLSRNRTKNPRSLLKFVTCSRCLSSRSTSEEEAIRLRMSIASAFSSLRRKKPPLSGAFFTPADLSDISLIHTVTIIAGDIVLGYTNLKASLPLFQRRNTRSLIWKVKILLDLLKSIGNCSDNLSSSATTCLKELYILIHRVKSLHDFCLRSSRFLLLLKNVQISGYFHDLNVEINTILDVFPLRELDLVPDVGEQVELLHRHCQRSKLFVDPRDEELQNRIFLFLEEFDGGKLVDSSELREAFVNRLEIRDAKTCCEEIEFLEEEIYSQDEDFAPSILGGLVALVRYCRFLLFECVEEEDKKVVSFMRVEDFAIPKDFCCPISLDIMRDPVITSSGQTYDRDSITQWIDDGHCTCPNSGQMLSHTRLTPNLAFRNLISQWCTAHGVSYDANYGYDASAEAAAAASACRAAFFANEKTAEILLRMLEFGSDSEKTVAALEIRLLAKTGKENRACIAELGAIPLLQKLLNSANCRTQENSVTAMLNLSILENNKVRIMELNGCLSSIVGVLINGLTAEARENAAATLFSLSAVHAHKKRIADECGAVEALALLLKEGTPRGKKDAVTALFNLSTHSDCSARMVESGAVSALVEALMTEGVAEEAAGAIALLARQQTVVEVVGKDDTTVASLVSLIRRGSAKGKENAVAALHELCRSGGAALTQKVAKTPALGGLIQTILFTGTKRARRKAASLVKLCQRSEIVAVAAVPLGGGWEYSMTTRNGSMRRSSGFVTGDVSVSVSVGISVHVL